MKRFLALVLTVTVGLLATSFALISPAQALATCQDGYTLTQFPGSSTPLCVDSTTGDLSPVEGSTSLPSIDTPEPVSAPSSALATQVGSGSTDLDASGSVVTDVSTDVAVDSTAETIPGIGQVLTPGIMSYQLTTLGISSFACKESWLNDLCVHSADPHYVINSDVHVEPTGWPLGQSAKINGTTYSFGTGDGSTAGTPVASPGPYLQVSPYNTSGSNTFGGAEYCNLNPDSGYGTGPFFGSSGGILNAYATQQGPAGEVFSGGCFDPDTGNWSTTQYGVAGYCINTDATTISCPNPHTDTNFVADMKASGNLLYVAPGSQLTGWTTSGGSTDPERIWQTEDWCTGGGVDPSTMPQLQSSAQFQESAAQWPIFPKPVDCPTGSVLHETKVIEHTLDGSAPDKTVFDYVVPTAVESLGTTYPQCINARCTLDLVKITGTPTGDCFTLTDACADWFTDANKADDYQCEYGVAGNMTDVDLAECNVYAPTFDPVQQAKGVAYGNPATGATPEPPTQTVNPAPLPGQDGSSCWPSGWSTIFNPASWVLAPIKCALVWAFVPDNSTLASLEDGARTDLTNVGIAPWWDGLTGFYGGFDTSGSGCMGPEINWSYAHLDFYPFAACTDPMATVATIIRSLATLAILFAGLKSSMKAVGSGFGFHFGMGNNEP